MLVTHTHLCLLQAAQPEPVPTDHSDSALLIHDTSGPKPCSEAHFLQEYASGHNIKLTKDELLLMDRYKLQSYRYQIWVEPHMEENYGSWKFRDCTEILI